MSKRLTAASVFLLAMAGAAGTNALGSKSVNYGIGRRISGEEIGTLDISVAPTGAGLPSGGGSAIAGRPIYEARCASCHGMRGEAPDEDYPSLVGGIGTLATPKPKLTVGSYWPYATTVWDYVHRAMPYDAPGTLPPNDVYAVTAYVLFLNGIVGEHDVLDEKTLPRVHMPNRDGFIPDPRPDVRSPPEGPR